MVGRDLIKADGLPRVFLCHCGDWPFYPFRCALLLFSRLRLEGHWMQASLRRVLQVGGPSSARRTTKRHLELLSAPPSVLTSVALVRKQSKLGRSLKRSGDVAFSLLVLGLGSPVFLLIAALVSVSSPGPLFYVQK